LKSVQRVEGRRAIYAPPAFSLLNVKKDLSVTGTKIDGKDATTLAMNLLTTFTTLQKLCFLDDHHGDICKKVVGHETLREYESIMEATCCGFGGPKLATKATKGNGTPCTVRDCLLMALMVDLTVDIHAYDKAGDISACAALKTFVTFALERVLGKSGKEVLATEVAAVLHASHIVDNKLFVDLLSSKRNIEWLERSADLMKVFENCVAIAEKHEENGYRNLSEVRCASHPQPLIFLKTQLIMLLFPFLSPAHIRSRLTRRRSGRRGGDQEEKEFDSRLVFDEDKKTCGERHADDICPERASSLSAMEVYHTQRSLLHYSMSQ